ncbi:YdeI/OmpD-associated family protein [Pontibacter sp. MBLB2868]|uniref:YdeI/OmpD-associated family protein n=1 Tax=Pontibacter sp. MBLB2868 TaxID=3451555 RepID=UPI003F74BC02
MSDLGKKLQLQKAGSLLLLNAPEGFANALKGEGYTFINTDEAPAIGTFDVVQLFVRNKEELDFFAPLAVPLLKADGALWIAYPKKSSGVRSDLTRDKGWRTVADFGYEAVRQIAVDSTWSMLRFKHMSERKQASMFGIDLPGIDRQTKTVVPPEDMQEALEQAGLTEAFNKLAFTHRKEYVVAVLEAKRPETRAKRIKMAIDGLTKKAT